MTTDHQIAMSGDHGRALAISLALDSLSDIGKALTKARASLDGDEGGNGFEVDHNENCPAHWRAGQPRDRCLSPCGLTGMIEELKAAEASLEQAKAQIKRLEADK